MNKPFNRTILELKQIMIIPLNINIQPFNRTILELKLSNASAVTIHINPFNRTILELKRIKSYWKPTPLKLLIVPFWN